MKYYKAREITEKPYLVFDLVAKDQTEYELRNLANENNIFTDQEIPVYDYGICLSQLNGAGNLEDRIKSEIDQSILDFNGLNKDKSLILKFNELIAKDNEISTLTRMGESTTAAEAEFTTLKNQYNGLK